MARARLLKPGFFTNEDLCELPFVGRLLFAGLWTIADKNGRLDDRPKRIKAELFPYDKVNVPALLEALESRAFIVRYEVAGSRYIQITSFAKHQHPHKNEPPGVIPSPDGTTPDIVRTESDSLGSRPAETVSNTETVTEAETETETDRPPSHPFALAFVKHHQERHAGNRPSPTQHAEAVALESEHGADWCFRAAEAFDWQKPPSYLRPWIIDHKEKANANVRPNYGEQDAGADSNGVVVDLRGVEQREPSLLERRRHRVSS